MMEEMFLLDNNVLSHLTRDQRASPFFLTRCRLPSEVIHEAQGYPDAVSFKPVEYPTTARVLEFLGSVLDTLPKEDVSLLNLYANKGAADPMLIACALDAMRDGDELLFGPTWVVVSDDAAVRATAERVQVRTWSRRQFLSCTFDRPQLPGESPAE